VPPPCSFSINLIILNPLGNINARFTLLYRYTRLAPPTQSAKKLLHMISSIFPQYLIHLRIQQRIRRKMQQNLHQVVHDESIHKLNSLPSCLQLDNPIGSDVLLYFTSTSLLFFQYFTCSFRRQLYIARDTNCR